MWDTVQDTVEDLDANTMHLSTDLSLVSFFLTVF